MIKWWNDYIETKNGDLVTFTFACWTMGFVMGAFLVMRVAA